MLCSPPSPLPPHASPLPLPTPPLHLQAQVRTGVLRNLGALLAALSPVSREANLPLLEDAWAAAAPPLNWRARASLAAQVPALCGCFSPAVTYSAVRPWALRLLRDPVASVREAAAATGFGPLYRRLADGDAALAADLAASLGALATARACRDRLLYVRVCAPLSDCCGRSSAAQV